ncbi:MAG: EscU/YscU/HrcU family type III secretion system export apparatus switch protein [Deltaproteobacteria bacterium]|nr:EscU/YscU/HrcU family type III secretion system export apparatus switch protein [Deltaproteobacteria bacterium]
MDPKEEKKRSPKAVALRYAPHQDPAPKVTAKGSGFVAQKIIELARQHGIPIKEDPALVQILAQLDLNQEIPPSIYVLVAEILAFVYSMNQKWQAQEDRKR